MARMQGSGSGFNSWCALVLALLGAQSCDARRASLSVIGEGRGSGPTLLVLDSETEQPLAGVHVRTLAGDRRFETDASGACVLDPPPDQRESVHLDKAGYGHGKTTLPRRRQIEVLLEPVTTVHGRVLAEDGAPVPGARITLPPLCTSTCLPWQAIAGPDGRYALSATLTDLAMMKVEIEAAGFAGTAIALQLDRDPRHERDLVVLRGIEIAGRVVDLESGAPLPGALV